MKQFIFDAQQASWIIVDVLLEELESQQLKLMSCGMLVAGMARMGYSTFHSKSKYTGYSKTSFD